VAKQLNKGQWQALVFAPLWVYTAVAGAEGPPEPSQFRRLTEELEAADTLFTGADDARTAVGTLRGNFDTLWSAYQLEGGDPRKGLKRARGVLKRLPEGEGPGFASWLVELAIRIGESRHTAGEDPITERERHAIRDVASWLGVAPPDLSPTGP